jgi:hypothetical protein
VDCWLTATGAQGSLGVVTWWIFFWDDENLLESGAVIVHCFVNVLEADKLDMLEGWL